MNYEKMVEVLGLPEKPEFIPSGVMWYKGGSSWTVYPPVTDTDEDYFFYSRFADGGLPGTLEGFTVDHHESYEGLDQRGDFTSYRKDSINVIRIKKIDLFLSTMAAACVCKALNLKDKTDRVIAHETLREILCGQS